MNMVLPVFAPRVSSNIGTRLRAKCFKRIQGGFGRLFYCPKVTCPFPEAEKFSALPAFIYLLLTTIRQTCSHNLRYVIVIK